MKFRSFLQNVNRNTRNMPELKKTREKDRIQSIPKGKQSISCSKRENLNAPKRSMRKSHRKNYTIKLGRRKRKVNVHLTKLCSIELIP